MNLLRCDAVEPQSWKNGGGLTRELLAWPARDGWALRISVADIRADGPFSAFAGVDRWFAVLEGNGVRLVLPGPLAVVLTRYHTSSAAWVPPTKQLLRGGLTPEPVAQPKSPVMGLVQVVDPLKGS